MSLEREELMNTKQLTIRAVIMITFVTLLNLLVNACSSDDACANYKERCSKIDSAVCVDVLEDQSQSVISCVYYAETCGEVHECLEVNEPD